MNERQIKRIKNIQSITTTIQESKAKGLEINKKELILMIMSQFNLTRRTANEYIDVAMYKVKNEL